MDTRYCDINYVVESFNKCKDKFDKFDLTVIDSDFVMKAITKEEKNKRNIQWNTDDIVCNIKSNGMQYQMTFHENSVENELTLKPAGINAMNPKQSSHPKELGHNLAFVQKQLDYAFNCQWDLSNINAGSIAYGGYLTDYEFTYDILI